MAVYRRVGSGEVDDVNLHIEKSCPVKILVCISKTPETTSRIAFTDHLTRFDENGVQFIVNPYDEWYALVRALELKEARGGSVTILSVGGADYEPILRKALAIGADDAVRIDSPDTDALAVAGQIAAYAKGKNFSVILCGKETISYNGAAVPGMVAEMLDMNFVSQATRLDLEDPLAIVEREIPGGREVLEVSLPVVVSAAKGMAEQRIPNMRGIMAARTKPLEVVAPAEAPAGTANVVFSLPPAKSGCKYIDAEKADELIRILHEEAKAL
jgi:electron transfer flavoprotein beta subunit